MRSFNYAIAYFIITGFCLWAMYVAPSDDILAIFIVVLTTLFAFIKGLDHLNDYINRDDSN